MSATSETPSRIFTRTLVSTVTGEASGAGAGACAATSPVNSAATMNGLIMWRANDGAEAFFMSSGLSLRHTANGVAAAVLRSAARWLTQPIVQTTFRPIFNRLGEHATPEQIGPRHVDSVCRNH